MKLNKGVRRFDLGEIKSATRTPQGFLMCPGFATRTGVFPYRNANGTIRYELRHPDDVFDPVSLNTLRHAPFTIEHPPDMITPLNVAQYRKGHTTDRVEVNRDMVDVDVIVEDQDAIDAVEGGLRELSSGYGCDMVEEEGVYMGTPYNFRQKNIRYNHLAGVKRGRAGPEIRLRLDSADAVMDVDAAIQPRAAASPEGAALDADLVAPKTTKKIVICGQEVDLPSDVADAVQDMMDRYDEMRAKIYQLEDSMKQVRNDNDISQPGVSPQVKVEQQTPDGRAAPAKAGAGDKGGAAAARGDDEDEKKKKDAEEAEKAAKDKKDAEASGAKEQGDKGKNDGDFDKLKKDAEEMMDRHRDEAEEMKKKLDGFANGSFGKDEKKDRKDAADPKAVQDQIRARVKLERQAEKLVPFEVSKRFDAMSDDEILSAVIKHRNPRADLSGMNTARLQGRFDSLVDALEQDGTEARKRAGSELMGAGRTRMDAGGGEAPDPLAARRKMVQAGREQHQQPLSGQKK